jgi:glucose uptake protein GlcU
MPTDGSTVPVAKSMHGLGIFCAIAASAWLGGAEAPTKLASTGMSPLFISFWMIIGAFCTYWTVPTVLKGTGYVVCDLRRKPHLLIWAVLAGAIWAVANTLIIIAVRDVGLAIAFPLWNINSLVGLFWGWLLFKELRGAGAATWVRVLGGAITIMLGAIVLSSASADSGVIPEHRFISGTSAALGAGLLLGTMYIPYRKAYLSGLNPLSFITIITLGEMVTIGLLVLTLQDGNGTILDQMRAVRSSILWLALGGLCWVIGDLFQHYATKYVGISRAIPLSNTNQLWGLAWGALVFGEFVHFSRPTQILIFFASILMVLGALTISTAAAPAGERSSCVLAIARECTRYGMDLEEAVASQEGEETSSSHVHHRHWWDHLIPAATVGVFVWFSVYAKRPQLAISYSFAIALTGVMLLFLIVGGRVLWKYTHFT